MTVGQSLENDRDVLKILTSYRRVAGKDFGAELDQTIADIDVYKRQPIPKSLKTRLLRYRKVKPKSKILVRGMLSIPVSYTHLDVYKRQSPNSWAPGVSPTIHRSFVRPLVLENALYLLCLLYTSRCV